MALDANIRGSTSGLGAEVDVNNNLKVTTPTNPDQAGYIMLAGQLSASTDTAGLITEKLRVSTQGRLTTGQLVPMFNEVFSTTALNTATYSQAATTQTITVNSGTLNLNASAITTLNTYCRVSTYQHFPIIGELAAFCIFDALLTAVPQVNCTIELGFMQASTNTAPTDGVFFRYDTTGTLKAVANNNGTEITSDVLTAPSIGVMHQYKIVTENDRTLYYIDGVCKASIATGSALGMPMWAQSQPFMVRVINGATAPSVANIVKISYLFVGLEDAAGISKSAAEIAAGMGRTGIQGQSGNTMGSTALNPNVGSTVNPAGAAMTNTTAGLGTGLGGVFSALPTLAQGIDGVLCNYQVSAPSATVPAKTLYIRGVKVHGAVTTVLTGGPVLYGYYLAVGHTNVNLTTAEGVATKSPRRTCIGFETFPVTAAAGTVGSSGGAYIAFNAPIAVNPLEQVAVIARNFGTVTTTGVITFLVTIDSYWE